MSIKDFVEKIKPFYWLILFLVIAGIFFALGRLSTIEEKHQPIKITQPADGQVANVISAVSGQNDQNNTSGVPENSAISAPPAGAVSDTAVGVSATSGEVIGSKTGKKYYFPWCSTVKRIKPENQVKFSSITSAKAAGYTPGGNCKGLQ